MSGDDPASVLDRSQARKSPASGALHTQAPGRELRFRDVALPVRDRLIVALDLPTLEAAERMVSTLRPTVTWFKVGAELFTAAGPAAVAMVQAQGGRVFLDLKFHDIPNTVARAAAAAAQLGVAMLTVHLAGGVLGLRAVAEALTSAGVRSNRPGGARPWLLGVTRLTSLEGTTTTETVVGAAQLALRSGYDGVIASAREAAAIKRDCGNGFIVVAPGIRPKGSEPHDQRRIATPTEALQAGADYLVIGRPIIAAANPSQALAQVVAEMEGAGVGSR